MIEIDKDLRQNFYLIDFYNEYNDDEVIGAHNYYFHILACFPGKHNLTIIPKPEIAAFTKTQEVISPNQLYEKLYGTDARGLLSVQILAGLNIFLGGDPEKSQKTMTEFLHNMSMQALSKSNVKSLLEFDKIVDLITNLISLLRQRNRLFIKINEENNNEAIESINNYRLYFELDLMEEIQENVDGMIKKDILPEIPIYIYFFSIRVFFHGH